MSKDKFRDDQPNKPNAGVVKVHDEKKYDGRDDTPNAPSAGVTLHPEKAKYDEAHGRAGLSKPGPSGGHVREQKRDANTANPQGADDHNGPVPKDRLHEDKKAFEKARRHEPRPAKGAKYADGSTTTKCN